MALALHSAGWPLPGRLCRVSFNEDTMNQAVALSLTAALAVLSEYDFIAVIDKSGSMNEPVSSTNRKSRWEYMQETATAFCRDLERIDTDGIDVVLFSGTGVLSYNGVTADKVKDIFASNSARGSTPLAEALTEAFKLAGKSDKKDFIIVFTDGVPDDKVAAANVIKAHANKQETDDACTVLFVQVGNDPGAATYLRELDDNLRGAKFDIVDAKTMEDAEKFSSTAELIMAAIND